jgi:hypothetical protein
VSDLAFRLVLVAVVVGAATVAALIARRTAVTHPPVSIDGLGLGPGLVVFTSTDCARCRQALGLAKATGLPLREVTYELEPALLERAGVIGVPLTLVVAADGRLVGQVAGVKRRALQRTIRRGRGGQFHRGTGGRR